MDKAKINIKDKKKRRGGAPTKYLPELCQNLLNFFDIEPIIYRDITITYKDGSTKEISEAEGVNLPFFTQWCRRVGISTETMYQWIKQYPQFSDAYKKAKECQEEILVVNALRGTYNNAFAIFYSKNKLGYKDDRFLLPEGASGINIFIQNIIHKAGVDDAKRETNQGNREIKNRLN